MVRLAFQAKEVDSRLAKRDWIASVLLENAPAGGYPPVPGGFLDLDTAWNYVLDGTMGLGAARPDAVMLLRWSMTPEGIERYGRLSETARTHIHEWLTDCAGPLGGLIVACIAAGCGLDALPIGLVCGVVFAPVIAQTDEPHGELAAAAVRLERFTGDRRIRPEDGHRWAEAAAWVVRNTPLDSARPFLDRADVLLHELHLARYAALSGVLPSGFEARMAGFAEALRGLLSKPSSQSLTQLEQAASSVQSHDLGEAACARTERVRMALRLARWMIAAQPPPAGFGALVKRYAADAAFVDWARLKLLGGDELAALSAEYAALSDAVRERREALNRQFAEALKDWNAQGAAAEDCIGVEAVLDTLVAPLAQQGYVLLLVVDGLSFPIFREICEDLARHGWTEQIPADAHGPRVSIAALPTVTEISRASLLSGRLSAGAASFEKAAFGSHPALLAASKASAKPVLFHKGELGDCLGLSQDVRDAVGNRERRVVAVVYNAVDDHLSGSDQLSLRWSLDDLRLLKPLLHEARSAGRVLIVTSDHGHVIDEKTIQRGAPEGDRWRSYAGPVQEGEIRLGGGRVHSPTGATEIVCAWSERLRYSAKKNGYHGGVSPQEVVVPLSVFLPPRVDLADWKPAPPVQPEWWEEGRYAPPPAGSGGALGF